MEDKIGQEFDGIISSITNFGMFVELPNTIEGLVHVSYMTDDYYHYDDRHYAMIGERTGNVFRIGDEITVRVINVNKDERAIDFEIVGMKGKRTKGALREAKVIKADGASVRKLRKKTMQKNRKEIVTAAKTKQKTKAKRKKKR